MPGIQGATRSLRYCLAGQLSWASRDFWIPATSAGMTRYFFAFGCRLGQRAEVGGERRELVLVEGLRHRHHDGVGACAGLVEAQGRHEPLRVPAEDGGDAVVDAVDAVAAGAFLGQMPAVALDLGVVAGGGKAQAAETERQREQGAAHACRCSHLAHCDVVVDCTLRLDRQREGFRLSDKAAILKNSDNSYTHEGAGGRSSADRPRLGSKLT